MALYEIDRDADTLIILTNLPPLSSSSSSDAARSSTPAVPAKRSVHGTATHSGPQEVRIKVSSKHLSLASRAFASLLGNRRDHDADDDDGGDDDYEDEGYHGAHGEEHKKAAAHGGAVVQPDGRVHIRLEGYDPTAVKAVLNVVHGRGLRAPRTLDLDTLARVAAFVDAFQLYEAVEAYADRWVSALAGPGFGAGGGTGGHRTPWTTERELGQWVFIAAALRQPALFREATRAAIVRSSGPLDAGDLPLKESIIRNIDTQRQQLIAKVVAALNGLVDDLRDGRSTCSVGCDAFLLGTLVKALRRWRALAAPPYRGVSFDALVAAVRELQAQVWYAGPQTPIPLGDTEVEGLSSSSSLSSAAAAKGKKELKARFPEHFCGIRSLINPKLYSLEVSVAGLPLQSSRGAY